MRTHDGDRSELRCWLWYQVESMLNIRMAELEPVKFLES